MARGEWVREKKRDGYLFTLVDLYGKLEFHSQLYIFFMLRASKCSTNFIAFTFPSFTKKKRRKIFLFCKVKNTLKALNTNFVSDVCTNKLKIDCREFVITSETNNSHWFIPCHLHRSMSRNSMNLSWLHLKLSHSCYMLVHGWCMQSHFLLDLWLEVVPIDRFCTFCGGWEYVATSELLFRV